MRKQTPASSNKASKSALLDQIVRFGVVGATAFFVDYGVLMLLSQVMGIDPVIAAAISFSVSVVFNYLASMRFVFSHRDDLVPTHEFAIFVILSLVGLALNELIMWAGTSIAGSGALAVTVTKVVATAVVMVWNFWSRKRWPDAGTGSSA